ncbi:hypothetical protein M9H77_08137 [Catharanthus roseus]|uniref:Uncharacterized protein n=1 Tax=Catharanthus roseus TaxID=4058 RepID=A0ACC0BX63_CATRO|nr:hypothetical protein M9H77_08137 [Catharanthus roseus]
MQGRNTVEEVLHLSVERGYTIFYRNCEDNNVLSDIVIAHPTSIAMIRTWPYVLIMDTTYKTNKNCRRLIKGILCPVLPEDPGAPLATPPEHVITKGRQKMNSTKRDKSYWEHVSIAHRKIGKSSGFGTGSGSGSDSGSGLVHV